MHTFESLKMDLIRGGVKADDTLLVHSSMKKIGPVEGGADTVLDVFMDYPGKQGLILFPSLSYSLVGSETPVFSVTGTPAVTGILPELFRKRPGVVRSLHPTHSLAAYGADAAEFTSGHERFDSPGNRLSPWGKLYDRGGKILFIGTGINCNTFLHAVEEWADVPDSLTEEHQPLVVIDYSGNRIPVPSRRHVGTHSVYYHLMEPFFEEAGAISTLKFGDAECRLLDARKGADAVMKVLKKTPLFFTPEYQETNSR